MFQDTLHRLFFTIPSLLRGTYCSDPNHHRLLTKVTTISKSIARSVQHILWTGMSHHFSVSQAMVDLRDNRQSSLTRRK